MALVVVSFRGTFVLGTLRQLRVKLVLTAKLKRRLDIRRCTETQGPGSGGRQDALTPDLSPGTPHESSPASPSIRVVVRRTGTAVFYLRASAV